MATHDPTPVSARFRWYRSPAPSRRRWPARLKDSHPRRRAALRSRGRVRGLPLPAPPRSAPPRRSGRATAFHAPSCRLAPVFAAATRVPRPLAAHLTFPGLVHHEVLRPRPAPMHLSVGFPVTRTLPPLRREGESPPLVTAPPLVRVADTQGV